MSLDAHQPYTSTIYSAGKEDIILTTIDNVTFHVDQALLRCSSHVFKTIFEREDKGTSPLKIEAEGATLGHLLAFVHPNMPSPLIDDMQTLVALFRVAKRYEMEGVLYQLRKILLEISVVDDVVVPPWYKREPLAIFIVAHAFDCVTESRLALRECLKGPLEAHIAGATSFEISVELMGAVLRLRQERLEQLAMKLNSIGSFVAPRSCFHCGVTHGQWRLTLLQKLQLHLQPSELRNDLSGSLICAAGHAVYSHISLANIDTWVCELNQQEEQLPLPKLNP